MQYLVYRDMLAGVQTALLNGRLSAQAPKPVCKYVEQQQDRIYGCAIGCNLDSDTKLKIILHDQNVGEDSHINTKSITWLKDFVSFDNPGRAADLQRKHDDWATHAEQLRDSIASGDDFDQEMINANAKRQAFIKFVQNEVARLDGDDALDIVEAALTGLTHPDDADEDDAPLNDYGLNY